MRQPGFSKSFSYIGSGGGGEKGSGFSSNIQAGLLRPKVDNSFQQKTDCRSYVDGAFCFVCRVVGGIIIFFFPHLT